MGRGNWRPYQDEEIYLVRYFDLFERFDVTEGGDFPDAQVEEFHWDTFLEEIFQALPDSFYRVEKNQGSVPVPYTSVRDNVILYRNNMACVIIDASADASHVGVALVLLEADDWREYETYRANFGPTYLARSAEPFFARLGGKQSVATSGWTSREITY